MTCRAIEELIKEASEEGRRKAEETPLPELIREIAEYDRRKDLELRQDVARRLLLAGPLTTTEIAELLGVSSDEAARVMQARR